jgi:predicted GNAT family acetyltransferase
LDDARTRGLSVRPYCPYVATFIREHAQEYLDLVDEGDRARFDL